MKVDSEGHVTETPREARQGPLGRKVLYVLLGSLALAGICLFVLLGWGGPK